MSNQTSASDLIKGWADLSTETGKPPFDVVDTSRISSSLLRYFAHHGAAQLVGVELSRRRGQVIEQQQEIDVQLLNSIDTINNDITISQRSPTRYKPMHACQGRNPTIWRGLGITLQVADRSMKPLMLFTREDLEKYCSDTSTMRDSWTRRNAWGVDALAALKRYGKDKVSELPEDVLVDLDAKAIGAWR